MEAGLALRPVRSVAVLDGSDVFHAAQALGFAIDYRKLLRLLESQCDLVRAHYLATRPVNKHWPAVRLGRWLSFNGYASSVRAAPEWVDPDTGRERYSDARVDVAVAMLEAACPAGARAEQVVLFASHPAFVAAVEAVQRRGARVVVASTRRTQPPRIGGGLRAQADAFIDLADIREAIEHLPSDGTGAEEHGAGDDGDEG
jgi:uncharacterized LabA/DUF88 family protein